MATPTFDVPWLQAKRFSIKHRTDIDGIYTAHEQRNKMQSGPRYKWIILIEKNESNFAALRDFIIARGGNFQAFTFYWDPAKEGDGVTYNVRLDLPDDEFSFDIDDEFTWSITIVQAVTSE